MKLKFAITYLISCLCFFPVYSEGLDCIQFKKYSAKYFECEFKKLSGKSNNKVEMGKEKFENSSIKEKLMKFNNSKTLSDLIKD